MRSADNKAICEPCTCVDKQLIISVISVRNEGVQYMSCMMAHEKMAVSYIIYYYESMLDDYSIIKKKSYSLRENISYRNKE